MRVKMDWWLFGTILALVCFGLVMVFSTSSILLELKSNAEQNLDAGRPGDEFVQAPPAEPVARKWWKPGPRLREGVEGIVVAAIITFLLYRKRMSAPWAAAGYTAVTVFQVLAFLLETEKNPTYLLLVRQTKAALYGFTILMIVTRRDYRKLCTPQWAFSGVAIVLFALIVAYFTDPMQRWLHLVVSIQPAEFAKPALIVFLAWFVTERAQKINTPATMWSAALALTALAGAVVVPDFGTALVLVVTAAAVFFLAGVNWRYTITAVGIGLILAVAILAKPYRVQRVIDFIDRDYKYLAWVDPGRKLLEYAQTGSKVKDTRYQERQAEMAVGSGGLAGRGVLESRQKLYLPEAHNDYIFAIIAEETGLRGALLVLLGYLVIIWRGYKLFWSAPDDFGRYLAAGVTTAIAFQALLNISVVLGLVPPKGFPLPLISYGGSSMMSSLMSLGLLLGVSQRSAA